MHPQVSSSLTQVTQAMEFQPLPQEMMSSVTNLTASRFIQALHICSSCNGASRSDFSLLLLPPRDRRCLPPPKPWCSQGLYKKALPWSHPHISLSFYSVFSDLPHTGDVPRSLSKGGWGCTRTDAGQWWHMSRSKAASEQGEHAPEQGVTCPHGPAQPGTGQGHQVTHTNATSPKAVHCALLGQSTISSTSGSPEGVYPQQELLLSVPLTPQSPKSQLPVSYLIPPGTSYLIPLGAASVGMEGDPTEQRPGTKKRQEV